MNCRNISKKIILKYGKSNTLHRSKIFERTFLLFSFGEHQGSGSSNFLKQPESFFNFKIYTSALPSTFNSFIYNKLIISAKKLTVLFWEHYDQKNNYKKQMSQEACANETKKGLKTLIELELYREKRCRICF